MKNCTQTEWVRTGAAFTFAVATCIVAPLSHAQIETSHIIINGQSVTVKPISSRTTTADEYIHNVRQNPRRKAAMDKAAAKIAARLEREMQGETFVSLRMKKGFTQSELAKAAQLPQPYLSRIENTKLSLRNETVEKLANALGVSPLEIRAAFEQQYEYLEQKA
ncbi:helix-turn-helix domain-containing protein [Neisseria arctica]|nr:helix-turn-helix transcriptional regulator [Neisseria arctica]UOO87465.1 helix-turn-helix domain-containing protein [Neisseria arctica]